MTMMLKGCPKCGGDLHWDDADREWVCLQCGLREPLRRWIDLMALKHPRKFVSVEPIMDFDLRELTRWIGLLKPSIIEIGADNYNHNLPEPPWEKVEQLIKFCRGTGAQVVEKPGLERLRET